MREKSEEAHLVDSHEPRKSLIPRIKDNLVSSVQVLDVWGSQKDLERRKEGSKLSSVSGEVNMWLLLDLPD